MIAVTITTSLGFRENGRNLPQAEHFQLLCVSKSSIPRDEENPPTYRKRAQWHLQCPKPQHTDTHTHTHTHMHSSHVLSVCTDLAEEKVEFEIA